MTVLLVRRIQIKRIIELSHSSNLSFTLHLSLHSPTKTFPAHFRVPQSATDPLGAPGGLHYSQRRGKLARRLVCASLRMCKGGRRGAAGSPSRSAAARLRSVKITERTGTDWSGASHFHSRKNDANVRINGQVQDERLPALVAFYFVYSFVRWVSSLFLCDCLHDSLPVDLRSVGSGLLMNVIRHCGIILRSVWMTEKVIPLFRISVRWELRNIAHGYSFMIVSSAMCVFNIKSHCLPVFNKNNPLLGCYFCKEFKIYLWW